MCVNLNLKILPKKRLFRDFWGVGPPLVCDQKLSFSLDPLSISGFGEIGNCKMFAVHVYPSIIILEHTYTHSFRHG